ncbi:hypothetical protein FSPOR_6936 [Fusarium sporotrichioides]|uniref:Uncharacterized protein n=1 Tax=Fusarium sporotrichioides TaxID=5514 RepID=A0A395S125_FUSSP|nr:hypothetical protein FSPOR_6936 [Fusarium sporotrichioides]
MAERQQTIYSLSYTKNPQIHPSIPAIQRTANSDYFEIKKNKQTNTVKMCIKREIKVLCSLCPTKLKNEAKYDLCDDTTSENHTTRVVFEDRKSDKVCTPCFQNQKKKERDELAGYQAELSKGKGKGYTS